MFVKAPDQIKREDYNTFIKECFKDVEHEYDKCPAHGLDHIEDVLNNTFTIMGYFRGDTLDVHVAIAAAIYHDVGLEVRDTHEIIAAERISNKEFKALNTLTDNQLELISEAVKQHRASYKGKRSLHGELLSCADIGPHKKPEVLLERAVKYATKTELNLSLAKKKSAQHLKDKFGVNGYLNYPECYEEAWCVNLHEERLKVDKFADKILR